jgi:hypothetical protein
MQERSSRTILVEVVQVLGAVVALGGYVLLVGAIVDWANLDAIDAPALNVVADTPRNELFGLGLQALAVWVGLATLFLLAAGFLALVSGPQRSRAMGVLVIAALVVGFATWLVQVSVWGLLLLVGVVAAIVGVLLFRSRPRGQGARLTKKADFVLAALIGSGLGVALELLLVKPGHLKGFGIAVVAVLVVLWVAVEIARWLSLRRAAAAAEPVYGRTLMEHGFGAGPSPAARQRNAGRRCLASILVLAVVLAAAAVEARRTHRFWIARVSMTNGTCVAGMLLVRDSEEVLLGGRQTVGRHVLDRTVAIPASVISSVQVIGPPGETHPIRARSCGRVTHEENLKAPQPAPLVPSGEAVVLNGGERTIVGPEGPEGQRGPEGSEGKRGYEGKQGPRGADGAEGHEGGKGPEGSEGKRGGEGKQGPRGADGKQGPEGKRGTQGAQGSSGPPGPRGPRGHTGPRGPRGYPAIDGS